MLALLKSHAAATPRITRAFIGPTLPNLPRVSSSAFEVAPPLQRGDLDAMPSGSLAIIIDGILEPDLKIEADEIERSVVRDIACHGSSSVGALLGAHLATEAVKGQGRVYEYLKRYPAGGEELVAVLYDAVTYAPMTVPLINPILFVNDAAAEGLLSFHEREQALADLMSVALSQRLRARISSILSVYGLIDRFPNYKANDALDILKWALGSRTPLSAGQIAHGRNGPRV
jgi:hypothetical protein